jgi:pre-mRNA-processing factor 6
MTDNELEKRFGKEPKGYIPGIGRGATGFTTRSDIGNSKLITEDEMTTNSLVKKEDDKGDYSDSVYDNWSGFTNNGLFPTINYDEEDKEADKIWREIDEKMESRTKRKREEKEKEMLKKYRKEKPKISTQFADLKKDLKTISMEEWSQIPDIQDYTITHQSYEVFTPVPDSLLKRAKQENEKYSTIEINEGNETNIRAVSEAKEILLINQLQKEEKNINGVVSVNPEGYLTSMNKTGGLEESEIGDFKKARSLLNAVTNTNKKNGAAWIANSRIEEYAGKMSAARNIMVKACKYCPEQEDVWLEAARLNEPEISKKILTEAVTYISNSVKIWITAANLETQINLKKKVLRKALQNIPDSELLWNEAIDLEDDIDEAKILLSKAVECVPQSVNLWLTLSKLETGEKAKGVLNKAIKNLPTEIKIWIAAAELEEKKPENTEKVLKLAKQILEKYQIEIDRNQWITFAEKEEDDKYFETCKSILKLNIGNGIEKEEKEITWMEDANKCIKNNHIFSAKVIFEIATKEFPKNENLWLRFSEIENDENKLNVLKKSIMECENNEKLWIVYLNEFIKFKSKMEKEDKEKIKSEIRELYTEGLQFLKNNEEFWLTLIKYEYEEKDFERVSDLFEESLKVCESPNILIKYAKFQNIQSNDKKELEILEYGIQKFNNPEICNLRAEFEINKNKNIENSRIIYMKSIKANPNNLKLWMSAIKLEVTLKNYSRARSMLEKAREKIPKNEDLWLESINLEKLESLDNNSINFLLSKALQECKSSGKIWAESIQLEERVKRKSKILLAIENCNKNPYLLCSIARVIFWNEKKLSEARKWFERSISSDPKFGDSWIYYYLFEIENGTEEQQNLLIKRCLESNPSYGDIWLKISDSKLYLFDSMPPDMVLSNSIQLKI